MRVTSLILSYTLSLTICGLAQAGSITVPTGGKFIANFAACHPTITYFTCPPVAIMLAIATDEPVAGPAGHSLQSWLISDQSGQRIPMGDNYVFWIATNVTTLERTGVFGYNGLYDGFPFPDDPAFWGTDPRHATVSVEFENTGLPFTFARSPEDSISANFDLSSSVRWGGLGTNSVVFSPEPGSLALCSLGLGFLLLRTRRAG